MQGKLDVYARFVTGRVNTTTTRTWRSYTASGGGGGRGDQTRDVDVPAVPGRCRPRRLSGRPKRKTFGPPTSGARPTAFLVSCHRCRISYTFKRMRKVVDRYHHLLFLVDPVDDPYVFCFILALLHSSFTRLVVPKCNHCHRFVTNDYYCINFNQITVITNIYCRYLIINKKTSLFL